MSAHPRPRFLLYLAEVVAVRRLSPHFIRITFGGEGLREFSCSGIAAKIKVWLPDTTLSSPVTDSWEAIRLRSAMRTYTVRAHRPDQQEVDIDFVIHSAGPAGRWAAAATPGQLLLLSNAAGGAEITAKRTLFVGDLSALPAIMTALTALPPSSTARVLLRVDTPGEILALEAPARDCTEWIISGTDPDLLTHAVRREVTSFAPQFVWAAGEAGSLRPLRRFLRAEGGFAPASSPVVGYWRRDTEADTYDAEIIARATQLTQSGISLSRQELDELSLGISDPELRTLTDPPSLHARVLPQQPTSHV